MYFRCGPRLKFGRPVDEEVRPTAIGSRYCVSHSRRFFRKELCTGYNGVAGPSHSRPRWLRAQTQRVPVGSGVFVNSSQPPAAAVHPIHRSRGLVERPRPKNWSGGPAEGGAGPIYRANPTIVFMQAVRQSQTDWRVLCLKKFISTS